MTQLIVGLGLCGITLWILRKEWVEVNKSEAEINESLDALFDRNYQLLLETRKYYQKKRMRRERV